MEWQQILGFYHVVKLQSFTRAAEATGRSQSALSQQIKALEEEFECRLIERTGKRNLRLTLQGEIFFNFAESVVRGSRQCRESLEVSKESGRGRLRIAAPFTTLYHLLPEAVKQFMTELPQVELTLLDRPQSVVVDLVRSADVDFGLALEKAAPRELATLRWKEVETVVIAPSGHPLCSLQPVSLEHLAQYPLILPPKGVEHAGRILLEEQFRKMDIDYRVIMESSNVELSSMYVEMGLGITCASLVRGLPRLSSRKLTFLSLGHIFNPEFLCLITRKDKTRSLAMQAFVQLLFQNEREEI
ncbi:MAG: LysR family transcriptional regulator [Syntrophobacteraceae bacterium]